MPIKIEKINAKDVGPLKDFKADLKKINLIYSKNEGGKSFLVEFLIRCLFKKPEDFGYIRNSGIGKVVISGLGEKNIDFSINSKQKLENILEKEFKGLPASFTKLLIVKSGEVELIKEKNNYSGINKNLVKELLSPKKILDTIDNKITASVKKAVITKNRIEGTNTGTLKEYYEKLEKHKEIKNLIESIAKEYNSIDLFELKIKEKELVGEKQNLLMAKRYKAYKIFKEIENLNEIIQKIPEENLRIIEKKIEEYKDLKKDINNINKRIQLREEELSSMQNLEIEFDLQNKAKKFLAFELNKKILEIENKLNIYDLDKISILNSSIDTYNQKLSKLKEIEENIIKLKNKTKDFQWLEGTREYVFHNNFENIKKTKLTVNLVLILALLMGIIGVITLLLFKKFTIGALMLLFSALISGIYSIIIKSHIKKDYIEKELYEIKKEFKEKFNEEYSISKFNEIYVKIKDDYQKLKYLEEQYNELFLELKFNKEKINEVFYTLTNKIPNNEEWNIHLQHLKDNIHQLTKEKDKLKEEFSKLNVDISVFNTILNEIKPEINFDKERYEYLKEKISEIKLKQDENQKDKIELSAKLRTYNEIIKEIKNYFKNLTEEDVSENNFEITLEKIKEKLRRNKERIKNLEGELSGLGISELEYNSVDPGIEFSHQKMKEIEDQLNSVIEQIKNQEYNINNIKNNIIKITQDDFSSDLNTLLNNLYNKEIEIKNELIELEATLAAQILTHKAIENLQSEEDEKIIEILESEEFSKLIYNFTDRYNKITISQDKLMISNDYESYSLDDISTGTREQVLLALRLAFAKRILRNESAFIILDDAFQHSDYERRELLINTLYKIVNEDWQIIYCTMDDHIKKIFKEKSKEFGIELNLIEL